MGLEGCKIVDTGDGQIRRVCDEEPKVSKEISLEKTVDGIADFVAELGDVNKGKKLINKNQIDPNEINVAINEIISMGVNLALWVGQSSKELITKFQEDINASIENLKEGKNILAQNGADVSKLEKQIASLETIITKYG